MQIYLKATLKYDTLDKQEFNYWIGKANITTIKTKNKSDGCYTTIIIKNHQTLNLLLTILNKSCWWGVQIYKVKKKIWWRR